MIGFKRPKENPHFYFRRATPFILSVTFVISMAYCTILFAQAELANASGFALNTKPILKI